MEKWIRWTVCLSVLAAFGAGCRTTTTSQPPGPDAPEWTYYGGEAMEEEDTFYGVGISEWSKIPDVNLQRTVAVSRGRNELAGGLRALVESVVKDYTEAAFTANLGQGEVQTLVSSVQKTIVDETLIGSKVAEVWINPDNGDYYVLMEMSAEDVARRLRQEIVESERGRLRVDAEEAHKELDRIIEENRQRYR